jgi:primosomal protein N' (replication factor Y)
MRRAARGAPLHARLMCHQCGETQPMPIACPDCGAEGSSRPWGRGWSGSRGGGSLFPRRGRGAVLGPLLARQVARRTPLSRSPTGARGHRSSAPARGLRGTTSQAHARGVIDADIGLYGSDLRAAERTFALMRQVSGRAGGRTSPARLCCRPTSRTTR